MEQAGSKVIIYIVTAVVAVCALVLWARTRSLEQKEQRYIEKEQAILAQVAQEEERAKTLEEYRVYVQTKQYVEKMAKEKLGLVNPDEILLKPNNE